MAGCRGFLNELTVLIENDVQYQYQLVRLLSRRPASRPGTGPHSRIYGSAQCHDPRTADFSSQTRWAWPASQPPASSPLVAIAKGEGTTPRRRVRRAAAKAAPAALAMVALRARAMAVRLRVPVKPVMKMLRAKTAKAAKPERKPAAAVAARQALVVRAVPPERAVRLARAARPWC